jgi:SAM-dependent methyltransferase
VFVEEAQWIERTLRPLGIGSGASVLDIGSSTAAFRTEVQPHIERHVIAPLRASGASVVHLDAKEGEGIDVVCDLADPSLDLLGAVGRRFELVTCCNLLEHVVDREATVRQVASVVDDGGFLLVTVPGRYRFHEDPIDTMFRPAPDELAALITGVDSGLRVRALDSVPIRRLEYYNLRSRYYRERVIEFLFWLLPKYRWRQSCVLLERPSAAPRSTTA